MIADAPECIDASPVEATTCLVPAWIFSPLCRWLAHVHTFAKRARPLMSVVRCQRTKADIARGRVDTCPLPLLRPSHAD